MDRIDIDTWAHISAEGWSSLVLGNGASIAIHKEFANTTLHGIADAKGLLVPTAPIFAKLWKLISNTSTWHCGRRRLLGNMHSADRSGAQCASGACRCCHRPTADQCVCERISNWRQPELRPHLVLGYAAAQCGAWELVQGRVPRRGANGFGISTETLWTGCRRNIGFLPSRQSCGCA